jgi:hypothetical protein
MLKEMIMLVRTEDLTREHLREFWFIEAVTGDGDDAERMRVWESSRLLPFVGPEVKGTELKTLYVWVPSLEEADLQPLRDKIAALERQDP